MLSYPFEHNKFVENWLLIS